MFYLFLIFPFLSYRKSSGFSRGASIYRGVTRSGHLCAIDIVTTTDFCLLRLNESAFFFGH